MAEHDNVHRNQASDDEAASRALMETGRQAAGFASEEEGLQDYVEGAFGEDLTQRQVGQKPRKTAEAGSESSPADRAETTRSPHEN